ncbi:hypothetical protein CANMA_003842 [Candida margitis]|uniref:uncharacterized protein n=1 Tax=Candida margitis TaxID=1775924 RepID=UPI002227C2FD|nr:uncharacterized protein CANMA_003842 [Candida margitis]KAI5961068.1 hypothetical protein CANMA_003842 [Candida margitis]
MVSFRLDGQVAIVTGATSGIGLAYAEGLASAGIRQLILTYRAQATLEAAVEKIKQFNPDVVISSIYVDFLKMPEDEITDLVYNESYRLSTTGAIDILINNAGINERHAVEHFPQDKFDNVIKVDLNIPMKLTRRIGTRMLELGTRGKIINTSSVLSFQSGVYTAAYTVAKGGLKNFTQAVANEWSARGVRVNCLAPGYVATNLTDSMSKENRELVSSRIPMGRWGNCEEFRGPIVFLCSEASSYMTGSTMVVDGGWLGR